MRAIFPCFLSYAENYSMNSIFKSPIARLPKSQKIVISEGERGLKILVKVR